VGVQALERCLDIEIGSRWNERHLDARCVRGRRHRFEDELVEQRIVDVRERERERVVDLPAQLQVFVSAPVVAWHAVDTRLTAMRRLVIAGAILIGCGGPPVLAPTPALPSAELSLALRPLAFMLGDWRGAHGSEHWVAAAGAMFGVGFATDGSFDVMIVDDGDGPGKPDGVLRFIAMPNGSSQVEFKQRSVGENSVIFANEAHDFPKHISYRTDGGGLAATIDDGQLQVKKKVDFSFRPATPQPAPELETADLAFAADTAKRGIDGWLAAFADDAGMLKKGVRVQGHAAISELMKPLLESGKLVWAPIASGKSGNFGFTVGKAKFTGTKPEDTWRSSYITIWKHTPAAGWKVWFDAGRVVNE
jgi:Domain of unknown function (DUF6265)